MATQEKRIAGWRAKNNGRGFEQQFILACYSKKVAVTRIPDGCKRISKVRLLQVKTPFDFIVSYAGRTALVDTKTCENRFFNSSIDPDQISAMQSHAKVGVLVGYVIQFREHNLVGFVPSSRLWSAQYEKGSIAHDDENVTLISDDLFAIDPRMIFDKKTQDSKGGTANG